MRIYILAAVLALGVSKSFGQGFCGSTGGFTITPSEGCAPLKVIVKNTVSKAENIRYAYQFNRQQATFPDSKSTTVDSSYVYSNPGTFTIFQYGSASGTGFSMCKDVVVFETRAPKAEVITCQSGRVKLTLAQDSVANAYDQIEINWGDGSPMAVWKSGMSLTFDHNYPPNGTIPSIGIRGKYTSGICQSSLTLTISVPKSPPSLTSVKISSVEMSGDGSAKLLYEGIDGVATEVFMDNGNGQFLTVGKTGRSGGLQSVTIENLDATKTYRFKLISMDACGNPVESAVVSSMVMREGTFALDEIISLLWENAANTGKLVQYQLIRDDKVIFTTPDQRSFLDENVRCGNSYKYEIVAIIENDVRSYSAPITIQPRSSAPEIIKKASVSVESPNLIVSKAEISGEGLTNAYDLIVERAELGNADFQRISKPDNENLVYKDQNVNTSERSYCYRFSYKNACNLSSPAFSMPVCSILLKNNVQEIVWNGDSPFTVGIASYDLVQMDAQGKITDELPKQLNLSQEIDLDSQSAFSFKVKAHSADETLTSYSNTIDLKRDPIVLIPDAFTPNGDGINDRFEVKSYFTSSFSMSIFNRWGKVIFQSDKSQGSWDGNIDGRPALSGQYIFKISASDRAAHMIWKEGSFLLIR